MPTTIRQPASAKPSLLTALRRGLLCQCPACGQAKMFRGYLRLVPACAGCAAPLGKARADDAPPYFTLFAVAHIVVPMLLAVERHSAPALWLLAVVFLPLTAILSLALLRPIKGATVGAMLIFGMIPRGTHG